MANSVARIGPYAGKFHWYADCTILLIVTAVCILSTPATANQQCPAGSPCSCELDDSGRPIVNCRRHNLKSIPTFHPSDVVFYELTLADNEIQSIPSSAFAGLRIVRIDLTGNSLADFASDAFAGLGDLEELLIELDVKTPFPTVPLNILTGIRLLHVQGYRASSSLPTDALSAFTGLQSLTITGTSAIGDQMGSTLVQLTAADVAAQQLSLSYVDLSYNLLATVPSAALATLSNLTYIDLRGNKLESIDSKAFATINSTVGVRSLDLSHNAISILDRDAFGALKSTLWYLTMAYCQLKDPSLEAIRKLKALQTLSIEGNEITNIDLLIDSLSNLQQLSAYGNKITTLSQSTFRSWSRSLRILNLGMNRELTVSDGAFAQLAGLEELTLDSVAGLQLSADTFASQRQTLRTLSLRSTNLGANVASTSGGGGGSAPWSALRGLAALQQLSLADCKLAGAIPDFTFLDSTNLHTVDLSSNAIDTVTQRSLAGLQDCLVGISLQSNGLQTLDKCVFYQFSKVDIFQVDLINNPLQCDCRIQWLYEWVKQHFNNMRYSMKWTCSAVNGGVARPFINLTDADFAGCGSTTDGSACESLLPTTQAPITGSTDRPKPIVFRVNQTWAVDQDSSSTLNVWWTISRDIEVASIALTCQSEGSPTADRYEVTMTSYNGSYVISGLAAATAYTICLDVTTVAQGTMTECTPGLTKHAAVSPPSSANVELILGVAIGGTVALAIIVIVVVCCCITSRRHRQSNVESQAPVGSAAPKHSIQTKRFRKQKPSMTDADRESYGRAGAGAGGAGSAITQADIDRALVNTVERLDPQSKDILASLLRSASAASLDRLGSGSGPSNYLYTRSNAFDNGRDASGEPWTPGVGADRHIYEELPDNDTYDRIPTDDDV